jgi:polyisoprenoid-binding protein YceI
MLPKRLLRLGFTVATLVAAVPALAQQLKLELDPAQTQVQWTLGDVLHTVHGTFKLRSGTIQFDSASGQASGAIVVDATTGESGNGARDRKMHGEILESGKFPEIGFLPTRVQGNMVPEGDSQVRVDGVMKIHGTSQQITVPVDVRRSGDEFVIASRFVAPYVQWGLKNPSTFILRVEDHVTIDIHTKAHVAMPGPT